ncbi:MAG: fasciclin domain-containing protein [Crocinitomicaceae bacterium]
MKRLTIGLTAAFFALGINSFSQTNVFDDIIVPSPDHTYLEAAILQEGLEGALQSSPALTVFAPTDAAFTQLATALNTDINGLLALPNLQDILLYHVLGSSVPASAVNNGDIVTALSAANTIKLTKTAMGAVYANQAMVSTADLMATNGYVHVINGVILPVETVVDVAIDNGFTSLTAAVVTAELLPSLTNPLTQLTVFAPTNQAFDNLATALGTDINGLLANPELADILLYHVVSGTVLSTDLANGAVPTLNGQTVNVDLTNGVMINSSNVTAPDLTCMNGVVHVIDAVLVPSLASLNELNESSILIYPNPTSDKITIQLDQAFVKEFHISDMNGRILKSQSMEKQLTISTDISTLPNGEYYLTLIGEGESNTVKFSKI